MGLLTALLLLVVLGACGGAPEPVADAVPAPWTGCDAAVVAGRVPDDFEPVAVYRCDPFVTVEGADATGAPAPAERFDGDLGPLLKALDVPDDRRSSGPCTLELVVGPSLWLVDADGDAIRAVYPVDGCGKPKADAVVDALAALTVGGHA